MMALVVCMVVALVVGSNLISSDKCRLTNVGQEEDTGAMEGFSAFGGADSVWRLRR